MKKMFFTATLLMANLAWAQTSFDLRVSRGEDTDTLVFSADYDDDIYSCVLELADLKVVGSQIRAVIDTESPRRCMYIEAPDYGLLNLTSLKLRSGLYKIIIDGVEQGTLDTKTMKVKAKKLSNGLDPVFF